MNCITIEDIKKIKEFSIDFLNLDNGVNQPSNEILNRSCWLVNAMCKVHISIIDQTIEDPAFVCKKSKNLLIHEKNRFIKFLKDTEKI